MNKNTILSVALGIIIGGTFIFWGYISFSGFITSKENTAGLNQVVGFINNQIKQNTPASPTK